MKDSGRRESFDSGMVRDTTEGKIDYSLALDGPMFKRLAIHLTKGAVKYAKRNWMQANGEAELDRFRESALRHFLQWFNGDTDEDHAAAVFFNINGAEYVKDRMAEEPSATQPVPYYITSGDRVRVTRAVTGAAERWIGLTGIVQPDRGEERFPILVALDIPGHPTRAFAATELELVSP